MSTQPLRVIIADDDVDQRELIHRAITRLDHRVVGTAATGQELVDVCAAEKADLVITDIRMPDMDGLDAAQQIYANAPLPIIVVSSLTDDDCLARAQEQHVLAFLVKPVNAEDLKAAIVIVLRRFAEFCELRQENQDLAKTLADRKVIERAGG